LFLFYCEQEAHYFSAIMFDNFELPSLFLDTNVSELKDT